MMNRIQRTVVGLSVAVLLFATHWLALKWGEHVGQGRQLHMATMTLEPGGANCARARDATCLEDHRRFQANMLAMQATAHVGSWWPSPYTHRLGEFVDWHRKQPAHGGKP